jgi:hypothetical protein
LIWIFLRRKINLLRIDYRCSKLIKLKLLSTKSQEKLRAAGFDLEKDINTVQALGGAGSYFEYAPLHNAAHIGDLDLINELLDNDADADKLYLMEGVLYCSYSMTPLMVAAREGRASAVQLLLKRGANLDKMIKLHDINFKDFSNIDTKEFKQGQLALEEAQKSSQRHTFLWSFAQKILLWRECDYDATIKLLRPANKQ